MTEMDSLGCFVSLVHSRAVLSLSLREGKVQRYFTLIFSICEMDNLIWFFFSFFLSSVDPYLRMTFAVFHPLRFKIYNAFYTQKLSCSCFLQIMSTPHPSPVQLGVTTKIKVVYPITQALPSQTMSKSLLHPYSLPKNYAHIGLWVFFVSVSLVRDILWM